MFRQGDYVVSSGGREISDQQCDEVFARKVGNGRKDVGEVVAIEEVKPPLGVIRVIVEMLNVGHSFCNITRR